MSIVLETLHYFVALAYAASAMIEQRLASCFFRNEAFKHVAHLFELCEYEYFLSGIGDGCDVVKQSLYLCGDVRAKVSVLKEQGRVVTDLF